MTDEVVVVRDTGAPTTDDGERVYEVVRAGVQLRTITMRDYDAANYARAMGFVHMQPEPESPCAS